MAKKEASKRFVLDIGAGDRPQPEATHAIDINKPDKAIPSRIQEYRVGNFNRPPKQWRGKFSKVVSEAALGASDSLESSIKATAKSLDFVTEDNATAAITADLANIKTAMEILAAAGFGVKSITTTSTPSWIGAESQLGGQVVIEAQKGYRGTRREQALQRKLNMPATWRMPIPLTPAHKRPITHAAYSDKAATRLSRRPHRGWKKVRLT